MPADSQAVWAALGAPVETVVARVGGRPVERAPCAVFEQEAGRDELVLHVAAEVEESGAPVD